MSLTLTLSGPLVHGDVSLIPSPLADKAGANVVVKEIARRRAQVVVPLMLCSFATYVATLVALSSFPDFVGYKVLGAINLAYVLALAQFAITFLTALVYALWTRRAIDPLVAEAFAILGRAPVAGGV